MTTHIQTVPLETTQTMTMTHIVKTIVSYVPLVLFPVVGTLYIPSSLPNWVCMWLIVLLVFIAAKILSWRTYTGNRKAYSLQAQYYNFLWYGLNPQQFLQKKTSKTNTVEGKHFLSAFFMICFGVMLLSILRNDQFGIKQDWARAWIGMVGISCCMHFGILQLLGAFWRQRGCNATPLMRSPLVPQNIGDFWGRRWNTAFHDLTYQHVFKPVHRHLGRHTALGVAFLFSGILHEIVISLPADGGYCLPTLYFLIQGLAVFMCRSPIGKALHLDHGLSGWLFAACALLLPVQLLFHHAFLSNVVLPLLNALGA